MTIKKSYWNPTNQSLFDIMDITAVPSVMHEIKAYDKNRLTTSLGDAVVAVYDEVARRIDVTGAVTISIDMPRDQWHVARDEFIEEIRNKQHRN